MVRLVPGATYAGESAILYHGPIDDEARRALIATERNRLQGQAA